MTVCKRSQRRRWTIRNSTSRDRAAQCAEGSAASICDAPDNATLAQAAVSAAKDMASTLNQATQTVRP